MRTEIEKIVIGCIGVYLQHEHHECDITSGWLDADPKPAVRQIRITPDVKLMNDLAFTEWDIRWLITALEQQLHRRIQIDESIFDDGDITIAELVDCVERSPFI